MPLAAAVLVLALCRPGGSGLGDCIISPPGPSGRGVRRCGGGCGWAGYVWGSLFVCAVWVGFFGAGVGGTAVGVSGSARGRSVVFARGALGDCGLCPKSRACSMRASSSEVCRGGKLK